jgi:hypothetical protein
MSCCADFNTYHRHNRNCPERQGGEGRPEFTFARLRLPAVTTGPTGNTVRVDGTYEETTSDGTRHGTVRTEKRVR